MPLNPNTFGAPPAPPAPPHASWPPSPHAPLPSLSDGRKRWPGILAGAAAGALVAALISALVTTQIRGSDSASTSSTTTKTVAEPTPVAPAPLPVGQADRQTCRGWLDAGTFMDSAEAASAPLKGVRLDDNRPGVADAANRVGGLLKQASTALQIAPGTTPILEAAALTATKSLTGNANSYLALDETGAATFDNITNAAAAEMTALCRRLAPL